MDERRAALGFSAAVRKYFTFLEERGFHIDQDEGTLVRYSGNGRFVRIYHARGAYALGADFGRLDAPKETVDLSEITAALYPGKPDVAVIAESWDRVDQGVAALAQRISTLSKILNGDIPYAEVDAHRQKMTDYYSGKTDVRPNS